MCLCENVNPFTHTAILQQTTSQKVENIVSKKEKLLIMSSFSFCHNVFKTYLLQMRQNAYIGGKGLNSATVLFSMFLTGNLS